MYYRRMIQKLYLTSIQQLLVQRDVENTTQILNDADKKLPDVKKLLEDSSKGLVDGRKKLADIKAEMPATEKRLKN